MSKTLRLADALGIVSVGGPFTVAMHEAAAELRRLHAENERLHQINQSHEMKLSVRGYEIQIDDLKALNAELVEALRRLIDMDVAYQRGPVVEEAVDKARAALAKVEDNK